MFSELTKLDLRIDHECNILPAWELMIVDHGRNDYTGAGWCSGAGTGGVGTGGMAYRHSADAIT